MSDQDEKDQVRNPETVQKETVVVKEDAEKHPVSSMAIISLVLGVISLLASVFKELDLVALCCRRLLHAWRHQPALRGSQHQALKD